LSSTYYWLFSEFLTHLGFLLALVFLANLLRQRRSPSSTVAWLLVILLLPYVGVPLYVLFGGRKMNPMARSKARIYGPNSRRQDHHFATAHERLLASYGVAPATVGNRLDLLTDGTQTFDRLLEMVDSARSTIHITTYILGVDHGTEILLDRLAQKARSGVSVKILIDSLGSWRLSRRSLAPVVHAGAEVAFFMPVLALPFRGRANLRCHRKLVLIDGHAGLAGGINLAWPYIGPGPDANLWTDIAIVVVGPAVHDLEAIFLSDWSFATHTSRPAPPAPAIMDSHNDSTSTVNVSVPDVPFSRPVVSCVAQVVASGPDVPGDPLYESLLELIFTARDRIWILTPYFVPDEMLVHSLSLAARRGVDVTLIVPARSNHITADLARASYLRDLSQAGARVFLYTPRMLHAKVTLFDDRLAIIGSANMDMRSLFLNYEVALFVSSPTHVSDLAAWAASLMDESVPDLSPQGGRREIAENVVRLLSPLL
jgi:cardiolipin synthase